MISPVAARLSHSVTEPTSDQTTPSEHTSWDSYAPYGRLVKMLLPSAGSVAIYDHAGELQWCSDGYERPELRELVNAVGSSVADDAAARAGQVKSASGVPAFIYRLRSPQCRYLGSIAVELGTNRNEPANGSLVSSLLRPVLDCLENRMALERTGSEPAEEPAGLDLLLTVDEDPAGGDALQRLVQHCGEHLGCALAALSVPEKGLSICCTPGRGTEPPAALDQTRKHLLAWAQLNNRPMMVNHIGNNRAGISAHKILSCPVRDTHARVVGILALFRAADAADFELRDQRILEAMARKAGGILDNEYDLLTGLIHRSIFERRAQSLLDEHTPASGRHLLYVDVDRLQAVNDTFGMHAGDEVLQRVAGVVGARIGPRDIACRLDADRFAVLLVTDGSEQAEALARGVVDAVATLGYLHQGNAAPVSLSAGLAQAVAGQSIAHLLAVAELACKHAKLAGGNRLEVRRHEDNGSPRRRRREFAAAELHDALAKHRFELEGQAVVGLAAGPRALLGCEVLVRMRDDRGGLIAPGRFLDAAADYKLMPAIDRWVLNSTVELLKASSVWPAHDRSRIMINVSAQSLLSGSFAAFVLDALQRAGLPAELLCFEIRESVAVNHLREAERFIAALAEGGCAIALDDFGSGLSALVHVRRLPVQYVKIDGDLVRRIPDDRFARSLVLGVAKAAKSLGVTPIAEHVENEAIATGLRELDVDWAQGLYLGRPQSLARLLDAGETAIEPRAAADGR